MEQISQQCERVRPHTYTDLISIAVQYYKVLSNCVRLTLFNRPKMDSSKDSILQILRNNKEKYRTKQKSQTKQKATQYFSFFFGKGGGMWYEDWMYRIKDFLSLISSSTRKSLQEMSAYEKVNEKHLIRNQLGCLMMLPMA